MIRYDKLRTRLCGSEHVANLTSSETGVNRLVVSVVS